MAVFIRTQSNLVNLQEFMYKHIQYCTSKMLTKSALALFTSATARPLAEREGSVVVCRRGWGGTESSRQVGGSCPGKGAGLGFPYQPPRKELINKKRLTWGGASKESLQGLRLFWPQAAASLSRPSPPVPLRGAEPSMTHAGQDKGERWDMSHTRHEGAP